MNILGMGTLEILVVLLIAFIFLGPERMVDAGRWLGKATVEVRRLMAQLPEITLEEDSPEGKVGPIVHRGGGPGAPAATAEAPPESQEEPPQAGGAPVAFRGATQPPRPEDEARASGQEGQR